ncbi:hypothetical protein [Pseudonocardia sp. GCM10023141]|uniref:hypothetical protein n=1 Tax=Pseudonocardia sp. GCM10023141 TaxID=3252653 RepID=UPI00361C0BCD
MSRTLRIRPTGAAAIIGVVFGAVALAGCGAGQITQTSSQVAGVGGASATVGRLAIRNAEIDFPTNATDGNKYVAGSSAPLRLTIVNGGGQDDQLVSASSPVAASVLVTGDSTIPAGRELDVEGKPTPVAAATSTGAPASGAPAAGSTPTATPTPSSPATPATAAAAGENRTAQIVLTGLREDVKAGLVYEVVLTFKNVGPVRIDVPVGNPAESGTDNHS